MQVLERYDSDVRPLKPQVILIQAGINDLKTIQIGLFRERTQATLKDFLQEQRELLMSALASSEISMEEMKELFGVNAWEDRQECLSSIMDELAIYAD